MIVVDHHHHPPPHYQRHNHDHQHAPVGPDMPILDQSDRLVPQSLRSLPCSLCFLGFRVLKVLNLSTLYYLLHSVSATHALFDVQK